MDECADRLFIGNVDYNYNPINLSTDGTLTNAVYTQVATLKSNVRSIRKN